MHGGAASQKIITTLRDRRQIEAEVQALRACTSDFELRRQAQRIAAYGSQAIPVLLVHLDRADTRLVAALGVVAALLDHDQITLALRQAVLTPGRTDAGRIAAMTILERYLGELPGDELVGSLSNPEAVALDTLHQVLDHMEGDAAVPIEYVQGLDRQQPDVVLAVVRTLRQIGDSRSVELLRLIAQDVRGELAAAALEALGRLRLPASAAALQMLIPIMAPGLVPLAERMLRKLQFSGVATSPLPPPAPGWRALVSAIDGLGQQVVWLIRGSGPGRHVRFLNVLLSDRVGAVGAVGHTHVAPHLLPPVREAGCLHDLSGAGPAGRQLMVEAPFDLGRRLVRDALELNRQTQVPVAGPLRLHSPWLWDSGGVEALPPPRLPQDADAGAGLNRWQAEQLLRHPALSSWTMGEDTVSQAAAYILAHPGPSMETWARRLAQELFGRPDIAQVLARRLGTLSEWLMWANDEPTARLALAAARSLTTGPAADNVLVRALVARDLQLALDSLGRAAAPGVSKE